MKRLLIVIVLLACIAAYATLRSNKQKAAIKTEKKEIKKKHECSRTCAYS